MAEEHTHLQAAWFIPIAAIVATSVGWAIVKLIEVDRTQEAVISRVAALESSAALLDLLALDRWRKSDQLLYDEGVKFRLQRLEKYHPPENNIDPRR